MWGPFTVVRESDTWPAPLSLTRFKAQAPLGKFAPFLLSTTSLSQQTLTCSIFTRNSQRNSSPAYSALGSSIFLRISPPQQPLSRHSRQLTSNRSSLLYYSAHVWSASFTFTALSLFADISGKSLHAAPPLFAPAFEHLHRSYQAARGGTSTLDQPRLRNMPLDKRLIDDSPTLYNRSLSPPPLYASFV